LRPDGLAGRLLAAFQVVAGDHLGQRVGVVEGDEAQLEAAVAEARARDGAGRRAADHRHRAEARGQRRAHGVGIVLAADKGHDEQRRTRGRARPRLAHGLGGLDILSVANAHGNSR
jgi:hypothetical protein